MSTIGDHFRAMTANYPPASKTTTPELAALDKAQMILVEMTEKSPITLYMGAWTTAEANQAIRTLLDAYAEQGRMLIAWEDSARINAATIAALTAEVERLKVEVNRSWLEWFRAVDHLRCFADNDSEGVTAETMAIFYIADQARHSGEIPAALTTQGDG